VENEVGGTCGANEGKRNVCRLLVGKPEGKRPLGRHRHRRMNKVDIEEIGWGAMECIGLAQDKYKWLDLVDEVKNFRVP
jgi:hypothetical protein